MTGPDYVEHGGYLVDAVTGETLQPVNSVAGRHCRRCAAWIEDRSGPGRRAHYCRTCQAARRRESDTERKRRQRRGQTAPPQPRRPGHTRPTITSRLIDLIRRFRGTTAITHDEWQELDVAGLTATPPQAVAKHTARETQQRKELREVMPGTTGPSDLPFGWASDAGPDEGATVTRGAALAAITARARDAELDPWFAAHAGWAYLVNNPEAFTVDALRDRTA